jgi:MFS transporter, DHA2 family, multidrug resistance protein
MRCSWSSMLGRAGLPPELQKAGALDYLASILSGQGQTLAFQDMFIIGGLVALAAIIPAYILSRTAQAAPATMRPRPA